MITDAEYVARHTGSWSERWEIMKGAKLQDVMTTCPVTKRSLGGCILPTKERYDEQVDFLFKFVSAVTEYNILEIGPAFGGFYQALCDRNQKPQHYTFIDGEPMLALIRERFTDLKNMDLYLPEEIHKVNMNYDLLVSNYCINEAEPKSYQDYIFNNIVPKCLRFFALIDPLDSKFYETRLNDKYKQVTYQAGPYHNVFKKNMRCFFAEVNK